MFAYAAMTAFTLIPVALDDASLWATETFVSPGAAQVISAGESDSILCLELPAATSGYARACLSDTEWDGLIADIVEQETGVRRTTSLSRSEMLMELRTVSAFLPSDPIDFVPMPRDDFVPAGRD